MIWAWAVEGRTWGPRRRAATFPEAVVVGSGPRSPITPDRQTYRQIRWCEDVAPLDGFDVVAGDCSVAALGPQTARTIGVHVAGQDRSAGCLRARTLDVLWDAEEAPLHPWAGLVLPSRAEVRSRWGTDPVIGCLNPSWAPRLFTDRVAEIAPPGVTVRALDSPEEFVGCDFLVVAAGWAPTWEARWSGVPYFAVDVGMADMAARASGSYDAMLDRVRLAGGASLPDDLRPVVPDHRAEFLAVVVA